MFTKQTYIEKIEAILTDTIVFQIAPDQIITFRSGLNQVTGDLFSLFCEMHKKLLPEKKDHDLSCFKVQYPGDPEEPCTCDDYKVGWEEAIDDMRAKIEKLEKETTIQHDKHYWLEKRAYTNDGGRETV